MKKSFICLFTAITFHVNAQNVGIGTSSPTSKITINGNGSIGTSYTSIAAPLNGLIIEGQTVSGASSPLYPNDQFSSFSSGGSFVTSSYLTNGISGGLTSVGSCGIYTQVSGTGGMGILIDHYSSADIALLSNAQSPYAMMAIKGDAGADGPHGVYGEQPIGSFLSYSMYANGDLYIAGGVFGPSDKNLKENIASYAAGLSTIMELKPVSYRYKNEYADKYGFPKGEQVGFLAQDIEKVIPEVTRTGRIISKASQTRAGGKSSEFMDGVKAVNYVSLIPILTQAIQEQNKLIEAQSNKINILEERIQKIEKK